jgi:hypothetical protein
MRVRRDYYELKGIHRNAPRRLVALYRKADWNMRELERMLNQDAGKPWLNYYYIHRLLVDGFEPTDATETGRGFRVRLFLSRRKRVYVERKPRERKPEWLKRWLRKPVSERLARIEEWMKAAG